MKNYYIKYYLKHPVRIIKNFILIKKYPFLCLHSSWSGKIIRPKYCSTELDALDTGWRKTFGIQMCEDLKTQLKKEGNLRSFYFVEIKEKFGSARIYPCSCSQDVQMIIDKYERISQNICCRCGRINTPVINNYGWYLPLCRDCYNNQHINITEDHKVSYIERVKDYSLEEKMLPEKLVLRCYSADKGSYKKEIDMTNEIERIKERCDIYGLPR